MTDFSGYFDTGGAQHQGEMVVAVGVIASVQEWEDFDARWLAVLSKYKIAAFHMVEIAGWSKKNDISKWPLVNGVRDEARRNKFLAELVGAAIGIKRAVVRAVALRDYNAANERYPLTEKIGGAYTLAQAQCLLHSEGWLLERKGPSRDHRWGAIVERGDSGQKQFRRFCREQLVYMPRFVEKKDAHGEDVTPLSLADMIAYEHHRWYTKVAEAKSAGEKEPGKESWSPTLRLIRDALPLHAGISEETMLERFCQQLKLSTREPAETIKSLGRMSDARSAQRVS